MPSSNMTTLRRPPHESLRAWQACHLLAVEVYKLSGKWPAHERYGLAAQVRSAAYSAAANIAEGMARRGSREFHRFLCMSLGSLAEMQLAFRLAGELRILDRRDWEVLETARAKAGLLAGALAKAIRRRLKPSNCPIA